jgi:ArsR family transcriptional regulator, arsenate/arsenite/antimonite-responsive transcriptional repressor
MGITKITGFDQSTLQMVNVLKAIAHPTRLSIILHLAKTPNCICGDLVDVLPLSQSTISRHLAELKNAGLIVGNIEGNSVCYCLNPQTFKELKDFLNTIETNPLNCCN